MADIFSGIGIHDQDTAVAIAIGDIEPVGLGIDHHIGVVRRLRGDMTFTDMLARWVGARSGTERGSIVADIRNQRFNADAEQSVSVHPFRIACSSRARWRPRKQFSTGRNT